MITDPGNPSPWDAAAYDEWFDAPWGRYAFRIERATLERATGPLDRRRVLDVGCGTGRFTSDLAERAKSLVGLDFDPAVLSVAARRVQAPLLIADTHRLPFPTGLFDVSVAMTLCEFVDDAQHVVAELVRVTRPGGRVVVGALNRRSAWGAAHRRRLREPPWSTAHLFSRRELHALGRPYGRVRLDAALIAPGAFVGLETVRPVLERIGWICPKIGAFQVLTIERPAP